MKLGKNLGGKPRERKLGSKNFRRKLSCINLGRNLGAKTWEGKFGDRKLSGGGEEETSGGEEET